MLVLLGPFGVRRVRIADMIVVIICIPTVLSSRIPIGTVVVVPPRMSRIRIVATHGPRETDTIDLSFVAMSTILAEDE